MRKTKSMIFNLDNWAKVLSKKRVKFQNNILKY